MMKDGHDFASVAGKDFPVSVAWREHILTARQRDKMDRAP